MVHRKAPSLEEARELFLTDPNKMLQEWADEWGVTHERVRQLRIESGVPQRGAYNQETAEAILEIIKTGRGGLTTPRTYEEQSIGLERFKTWMEEEEGLADKVNEAQKLAAKSLKDPIEKECKYCREWKPVEEYKKNGSNISYTVLSLPDVTVLPNIDNRSSIQWSPGISFAESIKSEIENQ